MVTAAQRKAWLLTLFWKAQDSATPLFDIIKSEIIRSVDGDANGPIVATTGNGRSTQFTIPDQYRFETPADRQNTFILLHDLFKQSSLERGFAFPPSNATNDSAIFQRMIESKWFEKITSSFPDWTNFRLQPLNFREGVLSW